MFSLTILNKLPMKKVLAGLFVFTLIAITSQVSAQQYKTAVGIRLSSGAPIINNSISVKHFLNERAAIEGLLSLGDPLGVGALLELHQPLAESGISWFYGGGAYFGFVKTYNVEKNKDVTDTHFGAQGVLGLDYKFQNIPLNLSLDWKPELNLVSDINFEPAAIGFTARFTFGK
jgi:hypothetical protein